jgi:hypothetical protein
MTEIGETGVMPENVSNLVAPKAANRGCGGHHPRQLT